MFTNFNKGVFLMSLKTDVAFAWKPNYERKGIISNFTPIFKRYIGIEDKAEYNTVLRTINNKIIENRKTTIFFENGVPFDADFELISYINKELLNMDINNLVKQDITLFQDSRLNTMFLESLQYVVNIALAKENFLNISMRNNFIAKLILWALKNVKTVEFSDTMSPKCVFYGTLSPHDAYFLLLLYRMTFDVFVINPLKDFTEIWDRIDVDKLSKVEIYSIIEQPQTFKQRVEKGQETNTIQSSTLNYDNQLTEAFFNEESGIYRPFQFKEYDLKAIRLSGSIIDTTTLWNEQAKLRDGFKIGNKTVKVPVLFQVIDGVYDDLEKYRELVTSVSSGKDTIVISNNVHDFLPPPGSLNSDDIYQLLFLQLSDKTIDIEQIKNQPFYPLSMYNVSTQNFVLRTINDVIVDESIFSIKMSKEEFLQTALLYLNVNQKIVKLMNNYDFPGNIPKIVVFIEGENILPDPFLLYLAFLHKAGFDIVIFNPSAFFSISKIINQTRFDNIRLDTIKDDAKYEQIVKQKKKGFWAKLFS